MNIQLSVIIPTYHEYGNIEKITQTIDSALSEHKWNYEIIFVDDNSQDGTEGLVASLAKYFPVRLILRHDEKGLATAVLRGIDEALGDICVVMDADLSHPADSIPQMLTLLKQRDSDFVIGSRYVNGGLLDPSWGRLRRLNSRIATLLALPLSRTHDPMSGFFAFKRESMPPRQILSPIGYKIGLELLVKGEFQNPREIPIKFQDRMHGESKLSWREQIRYLRHLRRLYQYRFPFLSEFFQFGLVGASGFFVDLFFYLILQWWAGFGHVLARGISFWAATSWNWAWNRILTFSTRKKTRKRIQWPLFVLTSLVGFAINVGSYYVLTHNIEYFNHHRIQALLIGVIAGFGFNFFTARLLVFIPFEAEIREENRHLTDKPTKYN